MADAARDPGFLMRLALVAIAMAIIAVVAIELHWSHVEAAGRAIASSTRAKPALLPVALRDFERAAAHDPGTDPLIQEAELFLFLGASADAAGPLRRAVSLEPQNALAWRLLSQAAANTDPPLAAVAAAQALRLSPPVRPPQGR